LVAIDVVTELSGVAFLRIGVSALLGTSAGSLWADIQGVFIAAMASCCAGASSLIAQAENSPNSETATIAKILNTTAQAMRFCGLFITRSFVTLCK
jgi:hypothetical protein